MKRIVFLHKLRDELRLPGRRVGISEQALRKRLAKAKIKTRLEPCGRWMRAAIILTEASQIRHAFFEKHRRAK